MQDVQGQEITFVETKEVKNLKLNDNIIIKILFSSLSIASRVFVLDV